jgi:hypothetical protein
MKFILLILLVGAYQLFHQSSNRGVRGTSPVREGTREDNNNMNNQLGKVREIPNTLYY